MLHNRMFGAGMGLGWVFWIVILGVIVYFILKHSRIKPDSNKGNGSTAINLLNKRYANGDIDRDEYFKIMNDLKPGRYDKMKNGKGLNSG